MEGPQTPCKSGRTASTSIDANENQKSSDHDHIVVGQLRQCEAHAILLPIPDRVVLAQEGVAQDPDGHARVHALDAQLALLVALVVLDADHVEVRAQVEVLAAHGDGHRGQRLHVGAICGDVAEIRDQLVQGERRAGQDAGARVHDHVATGQPAARAGALTAHIDVLRGHQPVRQQLTGQGHWRVGEVAIVEGRVRASQRQRGARLATGGQVEGEDVVLHLTLRHQLGHRHRHLVRSGSRHAHAQDAIEGRLPEDVRGLCAHLSEGEVVDGQAADGRRILADEALAASRAVLQSEALAILGEGLRSRGVVARRARLAIGASLAGHPQV
mmetsp:Transcript_31458/g.90881  ORF Transcript_31458/g.90881 Transcript_31458/m.90881 type:complete len:328 (-) Transcript_31458:337-1320(-)